VSADDDKRIAELEAINRGLEHKLESLQRQLLRVDKMSEASDQVHRALYNELSATSERLVERTQELARANAELHEARAIAEHASRAKSDFLANMSHELRTPLNAIIGYAEMLAEDFAERGQPELVADLDKITTAGKHLLAVISGILDIAKIEAGKVELYLETFAVAPLVREVEEMIAPLVRQRHNTFTSTIASDVPEMHADLVKLRQTLFNLLSNATKFTERGAIELAVRLLPEAEVPTVEFSVRDTGIGMTPEQLGTIFEAFAQGDASVARRFGGTGLGLTISQGFCRLMGGDLRAESVPNAGSTFFATIPVSVGPPAY